MLAHACGVECPKVAPLAAVEVVNPKMPCTVDADELRKMNAEGKITAASSTVLLHGHCRDPGLPPQKVLRTAGRKCGYPAVPRHPGGQPRLQTLVHTADCKNGCILTAKVPAILTSRSDSFQTKVNSIALAAVVAAGLNQ